MMLCDEYKDSVNMSQFSPRATSPFPMWKGLSWRKEHTSFQVKLERAVHVWVATGFEIEAALYFPAFLGDKSYETKK